MKDSKLLKGIDITDTKEDLICYSYDASYAEGKTPLFVAWPKDTDEISRLVKWASGRSLSIVPRGAGTGMAGGAVPVDNKSIVISLERMREVIEINKKNFTVTVEPGVINGELQKELEIHGLFYPPDPASLDYCTIGGNVATNAGGPRAIKYGVTREYVMEIEVVLCDGTIMTFGGRTVKRVVGYELKELLIGSEGTLGIISKITLKVLPEPEDVVTLLISFKELSKAGEFIPEIINMGVIPRTLEFLDNSCINLINQSSEIGLSEDTEALLLVELDGEINSLRRLAEKVLDRATKFKGQSQVATDYYSRERLWKARRSISPCLLKMKDREKINIDIAVPIDNISKALVEIQNLSLKSKTPIVSFGHAGDGNIHVNILVERGNDRAKKLGFDLAKQIFELTVSLGGAISGEHGIGVTKKPYIGIQLSKRTLEFMKSIKKIFDPKGLMNPGKIFES